MCKTFFDFTKIIVDKPHKRFEKNPKTFTKKQIEINPKNAINYFNNSFKGNPNTIIGYILMEGLQVGSNYTWSFTAQKKLTKFLDLNLSYFGRKSENSNSIHNGNIQLRAIF